MTSSTLTCLRATRTCGQRRSNSTTHCRQVVDQHPRRRGDDHASRRLGAEPLERALQRADACHQRAGQPCEETPCLRGPAAAHVRFDERHAETVLKPMDLFPDGGVGQVEGGGGGGEAAAEDGLAEAAQLLERDLLVGVVPRGARRHGQALLSLLCSHL